jgi:hypothetical protein
VEGRGYSKAHKGEREITPVRLPGALCPTFSLTTLPAPSLPSPFPSHPSPRRTPSARAGSTFLCRQGNSPASTLLAIAPCRARLSSRASAFYVVLRGSRPPPAHNNPLSDRDVAVRSAFLDDLIPPSPPRPRLGLAGTTGQGCVVMRRRNSFRARGRRSRRCPPWRKAGGRPRPASTTPPATNRPRRAVGRAGPLPRTTSCGNGNENA